MSRGGGGVAPASAATHGSCQAGGADCGGADCQLDSLSRTGSVGQVGNGVDAGADDGVAGASGQVWAEAGVSVDEAVVAGHVRPGGAVAGCAGDIPGQVA